MYNVSIDDERDRPVGTPEFRRMKAIQWTWTTEATQTEIASALGVRRETVSRYLNDGPTDDVKKAMNAREAEIRDVAILELKDQLQAAGDRWRTAEKPVKIYENDAGEVVVKEITDDYGEVVKKIPKVQDIQMLPDEEARFYARKEAREIVEQLVDLVGAAEPDEVNVSLGDLVR